MTESAGVHQLFEAQAAETPDAVSLIFGGQRLTYGQVERRANRLAHHLLDSGADLDSVVGLYLERSPEMVIAVLAALKAGAAFVPLDPAFPTERLAFVLQDTQARLVLAPPHLRETLPKFAGTLLTPDGGEAAQAPDISPDLNRRMFLLYTSGSTGTPRGIVGVHRNALSLCRWSFAGAPPEAQGIYCFARSLNFIGGLFDILRPLVTGRPLIILTEEERRDVRLLTQAVMEHRITRLAVTPSVLCGMLDAFPDLKQRLRSVTTCILAGEPLPVELCRRAREAMPDIPILNTYGATEVTGVATVFDIRNLPPDAKTVPIGRPVDGVRIQILRDNGDPVEKGEAGEICIGGVGVTEGYLNHPQLNAERFIPDPFYDVPGGRLFRTGDLGRFGWDGAAIEHLGRRDHQVNLRGFRVELGEIEAALTRHAEVASAAVTVREYPKDTRGLIAYIVRAEGSAIRPAAVREFLAQTLPEYMLPSAVVMMDALPLNASGKINRGALPDPGTVPAEAENELVPPQSAEEAALATLWRREFGTERIGIDDNFFDLGGYSLLAMRLLIAVEKEFGIFLPLSSFVTAPTIRQMALLLRYPVDAQPVSGSMPVPLQPQGNLPALFCPPVGSVLCYRSLAAHLAPDQPFYSLELGGAVGANGWEPLESVEAMAACAIQQIRRVQSHGPYFLGGYSFAGLIAFEMARQLNAAGESIEMLVLFDSWAPGYPARLPDATSPYFLSTALRWTDHRIRFHRDCLGACRTLSGRLSYLASMLSRLKQRSGTRTRSAPETLLEPMQESALPELPERYVRGLQAETNARRKYRPERYFGDIVLLRAQQPTPGLHQEPAAGWRHYVRGRVRVFDVPGDHGSLLTEPHVGACAARLLTVLKEARQMSTLTTTHSRV